MAPSTLELQGIEEPSFQSFSNFRDFFFNFGEYECYDIDGKATNKVR